ncbi:ATP-dependent Clp protease adaptor protein ClpS [Roseimaritima multifibrata]|uniref:ATP-dependent Clp protease adaptor protein ClpS n=1 Tax=Roseimaritima multifibrata TaxID=1930274 RepID=A0A517MNG7_9BACT|nr:ATP-dependent Clp protease adaptor ClpS [Roseimaritima multifibrata]QDS96425.1 ATP-dependent Clp protease adaptor protein ClpS [Roseimaritima multifibrata]
MKESQAAVLEPPAEREQQSRRQRTAPKRQPRYNVILWDDTDHSYDYVIMMLRELFGHPRERGMQMAKEVDSSGRVICMTTTMELAELKRDQIHAYGADGGVTRCKGSMSASIEPVPE